MKNGAEIGYDRLKDALPGLLRKTAEETENSIRNWYYELAGTAPQGDYITILMLQYDDPKL